jgi:hypothetical protein
MGIRTKLHERIQPQLDPGETIQSVFLTQTGPNPYLGFLTYLIFFWTKYWAIAATDRRIVVLRTSMWRPSKAQGIAATFPRETRLGPVSGLWGKVSLGGTTYWVHKRFHKDIEEADRHAAGGEAAASSS